MTLNWSSNIPLKLHTKEWHMCAMFTIKVRLLGERIGCLNDSKSRTNIYAI